MYYLLAQSEETSATDKWAGFVITKEGEEFMEHNAKLFKYDLLYNPLRFESWQRLANIYDEVKLLFITFLILNDVEKWNGKRTLFSRSLIIHGYSSSLFAFGSMCSGGGFTAK